MFNKKDLTDVIKDKFNVTGVMAEDIVSTVFSTLKTEMVAGKKVFVAGFGIFKVTDTKARNARNPKTGEPAFVPARKRVSFAPALALKEFANKK